MREARVRVEPRHVEREADRGGDDRGDDELVEARVVHQVDAEEPDAVARAEAAERVRESGA